MSLMIPSNNDDSSTTTKPRRSSLQMFPFEKALRTFVLIGCLVGFLTIVLDQVWKFYLKERTTASTYHTSDYLDFPIAVFCPTRSFNSSDPPEDINITQEVFDRHAKDVWVKYHSFGTQEFQSEPEIVIGHWRTIYTIYNGRCKSFSFTNRSFPTRKYAQFHLSVDQGPVAVFFLRDRIEELFLSTMTWISDIPSTIVQTDTFITLDHSISVLMSLPDRVCSPEATLESFGSCLAVELEDLILERGFNCSPIHFLPYLKRLSGNECQTPQDIGTILKFGQALLVRGVRNGNGTGKCQKQCTTHYSIPLSTPLASDRAASKKSDTYWTFTFGFNCVTTTTHTEMFLYDTADIVAAIGGALGMFLGWSCYQNYIIIRDVTKKRLKSARQSISKY
ncbi:uncharacterized protein LOC131885022 isoform X2 [Tigriopus californicus]|nr:uncharacterized protein LOC131885022 isoform X2 [Tigriopus californicus]